MYSYDDADRANRENHFAALAKRYALDAKMLRCRAAVHVEDKSDIAFWTSVLKYVRPQDKFHFITSSRNEYGQETSGVTQVLKYYKFLSRDFFICIDSDYRYLTQEHGINAKHFIVQTYTYSFENHLCYADGLNEVCERVAQHPNAVFSFKKFLADYSTIIYDLFIWHLYFLGADPSKFSKFEFNRYLNIISCRRKLSVLNNAQAALDELRIKVEKRVAFFGRKYPHADLDFIRNKYEQLGLTPSNVYLFVRGHNVYDMVSCLCKGVCTHILKKQKYSHKAREAIAALYRDHNNVDAQLYRNLQFGAYEAIKRIEADVMEIVGK